MSTTVASTTVPGPTSSLYTDDQYADDNFSTTSTQLDAYSNYTANTDTPMSRLSRYGFKMRSSSSFPSILNLYSEPISEERPRKEKKKKKKTKIRYSEGLRSKSTHPDLLSTESRKTSENRAIRIEAVAREQMERYEKYIQRLQEKVEKQREERRINDDEFQRRIKAEEEEERYKLSIRKRPKQEFVNDLPYIKKLPKSKMRKVVRLSDNLQKKGVLRTQEDVDKFWRDQDALRKNSDEKHEEDWSSLYRKTLKTKSNKLPVSESPDKFSEASIPPRGHTKHLADEILSARENYDQEGVSPEAKIPGKRSKSRHKKSLPPIDKKRNKSDKNRKKAKSWPDRDPGDDLKAEGTEVTANEV
ncbi:uncharacterized protein LOC111115451 isoform X2 [Crassostrea virginica]